ncbi:MAG: tRNA 2-thiouridine(34) synthase MnmA [Chloroflexi bacterium]|nr:tRNA 2-thiouridine(34) synthase MnmA [Chloroflexota bacterium]
MRAGNGRRVVVAMSGGVDSSVAAVLLAEAGYEVIGVTMRLWSAPTPQAARLNRACCSIEDVEDARATCRKIGARHHFMNFEREFRAHVIDYFIGEYEKGRTPYPCLACNDRLKFDFLMKRGAALFDAGLVATGHYARVEETDGEYRLLRSVDPSKDQSYVLYTLTQEQLSRVLLPVGDYSKPEIRDIARRHGLGVADKPDSQDICFVPDGDYRSFVEARIQDRRPGKVVDMDGRVLRAHDGIHAFTIGQRKGLGLPGGDDRPLYVTSIDHSTGTVTLGPAESLLRGELFASSVNWIHGAPSEPISVEARIRYRARDERALVTPLPDSWAKIEFESPQRAVTPGQAVVFFDGEELLGGGTIELSRVPTGAL